MHLSQHKLQIFLNFLKLSQITYVLSLLALNLLMYNASKNNRLKKLKYVFDSFLIMRSEKKSIKHADILTFITNQDMNEARMLFGFKQPALVWPVTIYDSEKNTKSKNIFS